ncbi:MAG TPA: hypothetical protein DC047_16505 [Blastocatellia bacterium]|nr:hypothetical protein [Blastocatellia bacterium]
MYYQILGLTRDRVKVTSHMVGAAVERNPQLAKEIVQRGHEAAGHGQTWTPQFSMTPEEEHTSYQASIKTIETATGTRPIGFNSVKHIQHPRDAFFESIVVPLAGGEIRIFGSMTGNGLSAPRSGCAPASNCIEMETTKRAPFGQKAPDFFISVLSF